MSASPTTYKELRSLLLRLDAAVNDSGGTEDDEREAKEDLASTAKLLMEQDAGEQGGDDPGAPVIPVALLNCNERGGNLWTRGRGRVHFIRKLGPDTWLNICYTEDNYPAFEVELLKMSAKKLAAGLTKTYKGDQLEIAKMNDFTPMLDENLRLKRFVVTES